MASLRALAGELRQGRDDIGSASPGEGGSAPELAGYRYAELLLEEVEALDLEHVVAHKHFARLALITGDETERDAVTRTLSACTAELQEHPANAPHWNTVSQLERSLTPFPSLAGLCDVVSRW